MKKGWIVLTGVVMFLCFHQSVQAQSAAYSNMLGIRISSADAAVNHSVTYKRYLKPDVAIEGLLSFSDPVALGVLLEKYRPFNPASAAGLAWFWGAGAYVGFGGNRNFGAQGAIGLDYLFPNLPINLSLDWKPELNFISQFSFEPAAVGFSARFAF